MTIPSPGSDDSSQTTNAAGGDISHGPRGVPPDLGDKLPSRGLFVSPMPTIAHVDFTPPTYVTVLAGIAAFASTAFAVLLFLKR